VTTDGSFTFNWQDEPEGFKKWLILTLLVDVIRDDAVFEELRVRSDGFRRAELRVELNGHVVDARRFFDVLESVIRHESFEAAQRRIGQIAELRDLRNAIDDVIDQLHERVSRIAHEHGIELQET
jgi:hypothetical protein